MALSPLLRVVAIFLPALREAFRAVPPADGLLCAVVGRLVLRAMELRMLLARRRG